MQAPGTRGIIEPLQRHFGKNDMDGFKPGKNFPSKLGGAAASGGKGGDIEGQDIRRIGPPFSWMIRGERRLDENVPRTKFVIPEEGKFHRKKNEANTEEKRRFRLV